MKEHYKNKLKQRLNEGRIADAIAAIRRGHNAQQIKDMIGARFDRAMHLATNARARAGGNPREITPDMLGIPHDPNDPSISTDRLAQINAFHDTFGKEYRKPLKRSDAYKASLKRIAAGVLAGSLATGGVIGLLASHANRQLNRNREELGQAEFGVKRAHGDLQDTALGAGRGIYKQMEELREARGEPDTSELDRQLRSVDDAFIAGYPRGPIHRAEVARNERVRGRINPNRPQSLEMSLASDSLMPAELVRSFLDLNKDQAAELEEPPRSKSKGDPKKDPEAVQTGRINADAFANLSTFPTRSNPPGTIPAHLANNPALVAHHQQANAAWRYSPTGETEYYDPTRHPTNPRNLSQAARDIGRLRRGDLLGNVSREDLAKIFRLRQAHKEQRRSGGPRTGGKSLSEQRLPEGFVGRMMKKIKRTGQLLKAVATQDISPGMRLQINRDLLGYKGNKGETGMNLKEQYKRRLQEDLQTPERAEEMSRAMRDAEHAAQISLALGSDAEAQTTRAIAKAMRDRNAMEVNDPKIVYGKGGRVVGKVVPTKGSAARTKQTRNK